MTRSTEPAVVHAREVADFLALVPGIAGFQPRDSVVLVAFRGRRTHGAMRFDLPARETETVRRRLATSLVGMLSRMPGVDGVIPVIYTDDDFGQTIPHEAFARAIITRARFSGFRVADALCVASDGWASYFDDDHPDGGSPLSDISASPVANRIGEAVTGLVQDAAALPEVSFERRERVRRLIAERMSDPALATSLAWVMAARDLPLELEELLAREPGDLDELEIALFVTAFQSPPIRDATMLLWAFGLQTGDRVFARQDRFADGQDIRDDPDAGLMMGEGPRPDPDRIDRGLDLLKAVVAHSPRSARPPLLCMLAWLSWALGRGTVADIFVRSAIEIDPSYSMARLLGSMLANGMLPGWAFEDPDASGGYGTVSTNFPST